MSDELDDQAWLEALGGKGTGAGTPSAAQREAGVIRKAMLRELEVP